MACLPVAPLLKSPGSSRPARSRRRRDRPPAAAVSRAPGPGDETSSAARGRALLESHLELIQRRLEVLSRRSGLPDYEVDELRSWALCKLVEDDYRILACWEGRSSFATYVTVVLVNLVRDYRIHVWGKWRPSSAARRQGREIVLLERLWLRDGLPLAEAVARLRTEHGSELSAAELERIAAGLPRRAERRRVGEEELRRIAVDGHVEARVEDGERARTAASLHKVLPPLVLSLSAEDRLLLRLHYRDGLTLAAIAPLLGRPQRELYSSRDRCLKKLRRALEGAGLGAERVRALVGGTLWEPQTGEGGLWE